MALSKLEGLIVVPTGGWDLALSEDGSPVGTVTAPAGDYYLTSTASGGSDDLLGALKTALEATGAGTYTCTVADDSSGDTPGTGKVTIAVSGGASTYQITAWTDTDLRDVLGFSGATSDQASTTGAYQARYLWLPNCRRSGTVPDPDTQGETFGEPESIGFLARATSGVVAGAHYNTRYSAVMSFDFVRGYKMWRRHESAASGVVNGSAERFWVDVWSKKRPFRYHPDSTDDALYCELVNGTPGVFAPNNQGDPNFTGPASIWSYGFECWDYVAS